jgi:hypothetical protein
MHARLLDEGIFVTVILSGGAGRARRASVCSFRRPTRAISYDRCIAAFVKVGKEMGVAEAIIPCP